MTKFFIKVIFLPCLLSFLTSCFNDPLSDVSESLREGFSSKEDFQIPPSIKAQKILNEFTRITIDGSNELSMDFKEGVESSYHFKVRFLTSDYKIKITGAQFTSSNLDLQKQIKFDFNEESGKGTFSWKPSYDFITSDFYRKDSIEVTIFLKSDDISEFAVKKNIAVQTSQTFKQPELMSILYGSEPLYVYTRPDQNDNLAVDRVPYLYINPSILEDTNENYGLDAYSSPNRDLEFRISDVNNIAPPYLSFSSYSDGRVFSALLQNQQKTESLSDWGSWKVGYRLNNSFSRKFNNLELSGNNRYTDFETLNTRFSIRASGYQGKSRTMFFRLLPSVRPEYTILDSSIETNQREDATDSSIVSFKEVTRVRYTLPKNFISSYEQFFDLSLKEEYGLEYSDMVSDTMELTPEIERFIKDVFDFRASVNNEFLVVPENKKEETQKKLQSRLLCRKSKYDTRGKGDVIQISKLLCQCDTDFKVSRNDLGEYLLDKQCKLLLEFSLQGGKANNTINHFKMPNDTYSFLGFGKKDVFDKFINLEQYIGKISYNAAQHLKIARERLQNVKSKDSSDEVAIKAAKELYDKNHSKVSLYSNYTSDDFFNMMKNDKPLNLHYRKEGKNKQEIIFFYNIGKSKIGCYPSDKTGYSLACKVSYFAKGSSLSLMRVNGYVDINLKVSDGVNYKCAEDATGSLHEISKICHFDRSTFSLTSTLDTKEPSIFILQSYAKGDVLTNERTKFVISEGNTNSSQEGAQ